MSFTPQTYLVCMCFNVHFLYVESDIWILSWCQRMYTGNLWTLMQIILIMYWLFMMFGIAHKCKLSRSCGSSPFRHLWYVLFYIIYSPLFLLIVIYIYTIISKKEKDKDCYAHTFFFIINVYIDVAKEWPNVYVIYKHLIIS